MLGYGYWAIEEKATGRFIGEIGFADFKRDIAPAMQNVPELGFALCSPVHGRGFGTEAVKQVLSCGDLHLPAPRTVALVSDENRASLRILEGCGYRVFDRVQFNGSPALFLERNRSI